MSSLSSLSPSGDLRAATQRSTTAGGQEAPASWEFASRGMLAILRVLGETDELKSGRSGCQCDAK